MTMWIRKRQALILMAIVLFCYINSDIIAPVRPMFYECYTTEKSTCLEYKGTFPYIRKPILKENKNKKVDAIIVSNNIEFPNRKKKGKRN